MHHVLLNYKRLEPMIVTFTFNKIIHIYVFTRYRIALNKMTGDCMVINARYNKYNECFKNQFL